MSLLKQLMNRKKTLM